MSSPQILSINLRIREEDFENKLQDEINAVKPSMTSETKVMKMRISGTEMLKITITNETNTATFSIVAEHIPTKGELFFTPYSIKSMNDTFFTSEFLDNNVVNTAADPSVFMLNFLSGLCTTHCGTIAYISSGGYQKIISEGDPKIVKSIALVDDNNNVYVSSDIKRLHDHDNDTMAFTIQTPINVWLQQNEEIQKACATLQTINDKMDYIGQYLIKARLNDEIEQQEFMDIFHQAGIIGFKNPSIQRIYKLLI